MISPEQISRELAEIQSRIPEMILKNVLREVPASKNLKQLVELAIADPDYPKAKKENLRLLLARGDFDKNKFVENPQYVRIIDQFVNREINKKIKAGKLPPRSQIGNLPHVREMYQRVLGDKNNEKK